MIFAAVILFIFFAGTLAVNFVGKKNPYIVYFSGIILFSFSLVLSLIMFWASTSPGELTLHSISTSDPGGPAIPFTFIAGKTESLLFVLVSFIGLCLSLFESRENSDSNKSANGSIYIFVILLLLLILSSNLLTILIFSSFTGFASALFIAPERKKLFQLKMILTSVAGDIFLFTAMIIAWKSSSSFAINEIKSSVVAGYFSGPAYTAFGFLLVAGILFKASAVPFHFWLTTEEEVSSRSVRTLAALIFRPAGIIAAIKLASLLPENLRMLLILIALIGSALVMLQASYCIIFQNSAKYILISQTGLILSAAAAGNYNTAFLLLASSTLSWLAVQYSLELRNTKSETEATGFDRLIVFSSVLVFSALPLSIGFLANTQLLSNVNGFSFYSPILRTICIVLLIFIFFGASYNSFRFLFENSDLRFKDFRLPSKNEYLKILGSIIPILGSLFIIVSYNPLFFNGSLLGFKASQQINGGTFEALFPALLVFTAVSLGAVLSYFYSLKFGTRATAGSKAFAADRSIDNIFAGYLIPAGEEIPGKRITIEGFVNRFTATGELSTFITFSLLMIVIFYFIFRSL